MIRIRQVPTLLLALLITTTSIEAQRPKPRVRDYFPLRVGNLWTYRHSEGVEFTFKILSEEKQTDGTMLYLLEKLASVKVHSWYTSANGWVILRKDAYPETEGLEVTYQPPKQVMKIPLVPGATWRWSGKSVTQTEVSESHKVVGAERVEVPAGKFLAMKVVSLVGDGGGVKTVTNWYADCVGLVKSWTEAGTIKYGWELIEYNFKKTPSTGSKSSTKR